MVAGVDFDVSELNKLAAELDVASPRVGAKSATQVRRTTAAIERDAKIFVPVDEGILRDSIHSEFIGDGRGSEIEGQVGPTEDYGIFVEVGTSVMAPQSFMGPALDRNTPGFVDGMGDAVGDIL